MNIEYFQDFIELARKLNFREASAALNMSQSALSKHIKALEGSYGTTLFARDRKSVELTEAGAVLLEHAQAIIQAYEASLEAVAYSKNSRPLIVSGVIESPGEHSVVASLIDYISEQNITRRVRIKNAGNMSPKEQIESLRNGSFDCFVSYNLSEESHEDIEITHLCNIPLNIAVSQKSALASKETIKLAELSGAVFIHLSGPNFTPTWHLIEALLNQNGIPHLEKAIPTESIYDYMNIDLGNCVFAIPQSGSVDPDASHQRKAKLLEVEEEGFTLSLDAAYLKSAKDESLDCLIEGLRTCYQNVGNQQ